MLIIPFVLDDAQIHREFKKGEVHSYRIHVESDEGAGRVQYDYTFWTRCQSLASDEAEPKIEIKVLGLHETAEKRTIRKALAGAGTLSLPQTGLPELIRDTIFAGPFWCPLLTLYLPEDIKGDGFDSSVALGAGSKMTGKGSIKNLHLDFTGKIEGEKIKALDVKLDWTVDDRGWLTGGEGTVADDSETISFKVQRA